MKALLSRLLYRLGTGRWGRFQFYEGAGPKPKGTSEPSPGVYVHIPFCRHLCPFCPYTKTLHEENLANRYKGALLAEIKQSLEDTEGGTYPSLYFGGGTPFLTPDLLCSVMKLLGPHLAEDAQVGIELHPKDITDSSLEMLRGMGVTALSVGIQSFSDALLRELGRDHLAQDSLRGVKKAVKAGFRGINGDLITGIPGGTVLQAVNDFKILADLGVSQVSAYPLMDFSFTRRKSKLPLLEQWRLLDLLDETADSRGYVRTSVWTWTLPKSPGYTSVTRESYLGFGAGAATYVNGYFGLNCFDTAEYVQAIENNVSPVSLHIKLTPDEHALYRLFWTCYEGAPNLAAFEQPFVHRLARLACTFGFLKERPSGEFDLTRAGFKLFHVLERYYTNTYIERLWRACKREAFPKGITL